MTDTTNRTNTELRWLKRWQIVIGDLQPRKHFEQAKIDNLVASLKEHGFDPGISRLLVRPLQAAKIEHDEDSKHYFIYRLSIDGALWEPVETAESAEDAEAKRQAAEVYELVLGECRYRGSEVAEIELLPAAIQEMDDLTALKKQLVENMQRAELTPIEEAMAFARLKEMGQTTEEIAQSVGRSREWVKDRLTLCRLFGTPVAAAIEAGTITVSHGEVLAKVPSSQLRLELLQKVLNPPTGAPAPWPREELDRHIKLDYLVDLRTAKFDKTDENLVPVEFEEGKEFENEHRLFGGACFSANRGGPGEPLDCPFATAPAGGNKMSSARMCTNPQCFQMKEIAAHERWRALVAADPSEEREVITLSHAENAELWNESGRAVAFHSPYVELDEAPATSELRSDVEVAYIWRHLIKDQAVPIVLGRDTAGKVHELVRHDLAKKAAHLNGHKIFRDSEREQRTDSERSSTAPAPSQTRDERSETETLETKRQREVASRIRAAEIAAIVAAAEGKECRGQFRLPKAFYQQLLFTLLSVGESFDCQGADSITRAVMNRRGLELEEASVTGLTIGQQFGLAVEMLMALEEEGKESWANVFGVDLKSTRKAAEKKAARAKVTTAAKEEEKKAA